MTCGSSSTIKMLGEPSPRIWHLQHKGIGNEHDQTCPAKRTVLDVEVAALGFGSSFRDRQPQARPGAAIAQSLEFVENAVAGGCRYAGSCVAHFESHAVGVDPPDDLHRRAR